MSYDIAQSFSLNVDRMEMKGSFASNNVYPRTYEKFTWQAKDRYAESKSVKFGILSEQDAFKISILSDLVGGSIQLSSSTSFKYRYALHQLLERLSKEDYRFWDYSRLIHETSLNYYESGELVVKKFEGEEYRKALLELKRHADYFFEILNQKPERGEFLIKVGGAFITKVNKRTYRYGYIPAYAKKYTTRWEAELANQTVRGTVIDYKSVAPARYGG